MISGYLFSQVNTDKSHENFTNTSNGSLENFSAQSFQIISVSRGEILPYSGPRHTTTGRNNIINIPKDVGNVYPKPEPINQDNDNLITGAKYVKSILSLFCVSSLPKQNIQSISPLTNSEDYFYHDKAGNMSLTKNNLAFSTHSYNSFLEKSYANLNLFNERVSIYPNPTPSFVTISWDNDLEKLIYQINLISMNDGNYIPMPNRNKIKHKVTIDLTTKPKGIYILNIALKTGQTISRNIIKN